MFANPTVQDFIDRELGGNTPLSRPPPPPPAYRGALARALLGDITRPAISAPIQPPAIEAPRRPITQPLPSVGVNRGSVSQEQQGVPNSARSIGMGSSALTTGLEKLGTGISGALTNYAASRAQQQAAIANASSLPGAPVFGLPSSPKPLGAPPMFTRPMGAAPPPGDIVSYVRNAAVQRGIDPDVAVKVAQSEGLGSYTGDKGSSFGPFQLHYGGVAGGGNAVSGLGDTFTKTTGLDARDPSTVQQQIDFSLDQAAKGGWGAWHGAANAGIGNFEGIGQAPPASNAPAGVQQGIYNGQPYTYQTQPALGAQSMLAPQTDPLTAALAGQGAQGANAPPPMAPGIVADLTNPFLFGGGQFGAG